MTRMLSYKEQAAWRKLYREGKLEEMWIDNRRLTMEEVRTLL